MAITLSELLESETQVACVVQGGGMRGIYSISALAELERCGYTNRFGAIYGSSAGALNSAYFLAGQAEEGVAIYIHHLSGSRFINLLRCRPIIDIDYLIDDVLMNQLPLDQKAVVTSATDLFVPLTNAQTGHVQYFNAREQSVPLMELLRAAAAMPVVFGKEIVINEQRYVDGGLVDRVPLLHAITNGWENIVVILTRPLGFRVRAASPIMRRLLRNTALMCGHSPGVVRLIGTDCGPMNRAMAILTGDTRDVTANIWVVAPSEGDRIASRLTRDKATLSKTAAKAQMNVRSALCHEQVTYASGGGRGSGGLTSGALARVMRRR